MPEIPNPLRIRLEPNSESDRRYGEERDRQTDQIRTAKHLNVISAFGVAGAIVYGFVAYLQWCATNEAVKAAKYANQQGRDQFVAAQRPYVWMIPGFTPGGDISKGKNLVFGHDNERVQVTVFYENYGLSPAFITKIDSLIAAPPNACEQLHTRKMEDMVGIVPTGKVDNITLRINTIDNAHEAAVARTIIASNFVGSATLLRLRYHDQSGNSYETDMAIEALPKGASDLCQNANLNLSRFINCQEEKCQD